MFKPIPPIPDAAANTEKRREKKTQKLGQKMQLKKKYLLRANDEGCSERRTNKIERSREEDECDL